MPYDPHATDDEDLDPTESAARRFTDFDCPVCSANNPCDDPFGQGDAVLCSYCGQEFDVAVSESGRLRLRET